MGVNLKFHVTKIFLCLHAFWEREWRLRCTHTIRSLTCVSLVVCVARKLRPYQSYSRRGDRIDWDFCVAFSGGLGRYAAVTQRLPVQLSTALQMMKKPSAILSEEWVTRLWYAAVHSIWPQQSQTMLAACSSTCTSILSSRFASYGNLLARTDLCPSSAIAQHTCPTRGCHRTPPPPPLPREGS